MMFPLMELHVWESDTYWSGIMKPAFFPGSLVLTRLYKFHLRSEESLRPDRRSKQGASLSVQLFIITGGKIHGRVCDNETLLSWFWKY